MAFMTISNAISSGIKRNVAISELKHQDKLEEIKAQLAKAKDLRVVTIARQHTEALREHNEWRQGLNEAEQSQFDKSLALIANALNS